MGKAVFQISRMIRVPVRTASRRRLFRVNAMWEYAIIPDSEWPANADPVNNYESKIKASFIDNVCSMLGKGEVLQDGRSSKPVETPASKTKGKPVGLGSDKPEAAEPAKAKPASTDSES